MVAYYAYWKRISIARRLLAPHEFSTTKDLTAWIDAVMKKDKERTPRGERKRAAA